MRSENVYFIEMAISQKDVNIVWHKYDFPGEYGGLKGLGFVSNGQITTVIEPVKICSISL